MPAPMLPVVQRSGCPVPYLPPEVIDYIIDHLWDAKDSLKACSLVCRAWVPAASLHLLTINPLVCETQTSLASLQGLSRLRLYIDGINIRESGFCTGTAWACKEMKTLQPLRFHSLRVLEFWGVQIKRDGAKFIARRLVRQAKRSLKLLNLHYCTFESAATIVSLLLQCSRLETLSIADPCFLSYGTPPPRNRRGKERKTLQLTSLHLQHSPSTIDFIPDIVANFRMPQLKTLRLEQWGIVGSRSTGLMLQLCQEIGPTVRHLYIQPVVFEASKGTMDWLRYFTSLQSMEIDCSECGLKPRNIKIFPVLETLPNPAMVRSITISHLPPDVSRACLALDEIVDDRGLQQLDSLQAMEFLLTKAPSGEEKSYIQDRVGLFVSQQKMRMTVVSDVENL